MQQVAECHGVASSHEIGELGGPVGWVVDVQLLEQSCRLIALRDEVHRVVDQGL